ncbi:MAG: EamA family transporter [Bacteroidetes bacterium]|jgi:drug/metabolite transporter (DMT)-like permease|nr:EamA family transporter [Bacteroidota bacterium]
MPKTDTSLKYDLALAFVVCVWGVNFAVVKAALAVMHPHVMNAFRFLVSFAVLGGLYLWRQRQRGHGFFAPLRGRVWQLAAMGLLGYFFYQFCFIVGVNNTTAGSAALIMASAPLSTALVGRIWGFERLRLPAVVGLLAMAVGVVVIVLGGTKTVTFGPTTLFGNVMMVAAALLWGTYTAFNTPLSRTTSPISIAFFGLLFALPLLLGLSVPYLDTVAWEQVTAWIWLAIVFSGGLSTGLAIAIWNSAVRKVGASQTAAYGNVTPVVGLLSGLVFLGEPVAWPQIAGGVLILAGLVIVRRYRHRRRPAPLPPTAK